MNQDVKNIIFFFEMVTNSTAKLVSIFQKSGIPPENLRKTIKTMNKYAVKTLLPLLNELSLKGLRDHLSK